MEIQPGRIPQDTYLAGRNALPHHKKQVPSS